MPVLIFKSNTSKSCGVFLITWTATNHGTRVKKLQTHQNGYQYFGFSINKAETQPWMYG